MAIPNDDCAQCCLLALRGRASSAQAVGEDSYTVSLDRFLYKSETLNYRTQLTRVCEDPGDSFGEDITTDATVALHWEAVTATEENPYPDPRNLTIVVTESDPDAVWSCGILTSGSSMTYTPSPVAGGLKKTVSETGATFSGTSWGEETVPAYCEGTGIVTEIGSSFSLSSPDSYTNVRTRLSAAQAGGWALGGYGFDATDYHSFDDSTYPALNYYSAAGGTYYGLWSLFNPTSGCIFGGGETGDMALTSVTTNFGLPMANHPYFKSRHMTYELDVAHNLRRLYQLRDFHGCFSVRGTYPRTLTFEKVTRACWMELHTLSICTATSDVTTETKTDHLYAENEIFDPVDLYGSTEFDHASWSNANVAPQFEDIAWSADDENFGVLHSKFCFRNRLLFTASERVKVTIQTALVNYQDIYDDIGNPDWAAVLGTEVSAPTLSEVTIELTNTARVAGRFTHEIADDLKVRPTNYRQEVWLKVTRVFTEVPDSADIEHPLGEVNILCSRRYGNMGFPQLNDQAAGASYKGARGFKKSSRWFAKMRHVHDETLVSSGSCPTPACVTYANTGVDLATEVEFECLLDPALTYESWTDLRKVFERDWRCTGAISSLGADEWEVPFVNRSGRPQVWGSLGFSTAALTATKTSTATSTGLLYAIASPSAVPYRYLNGQAQQEQDMIGDAFTVAEGCSTNSICTDDCSGPRNAAYSQYRHAGTTTPIADPFFGLNNIISVETFTVDVDQSTTGYFGRKDEEETRITEDAMTTDVLYFQADDVGTYVTLRNFWLR